MGPISTAFCVVLPLSVALHLFKGRKRPGDDRRDPVIIPERKTLSQQYSERPRDYTRALPVETPEPKPVANDIKPVVMRDDSVKDDTISALRNLGMTKASATRLAGQVWDQTPDDITLDDMIKRCLKALNK